MEEFSVFESLDIENYIPTYKQEIAHNAPHTFKLYGGAMGGGKGFPLSFQVVTPTGYKPNGELKIGDRVCNPDGSICYVTHLHPVKEQDQYVFTLSNGDEVITDSDHIWYGGWRRDKSDFCKSWDNINCKKTSPEIYEHTKKQIGKVKKKYFKIPICDPVLFDDIYRYQRTVDAYLLGLLLGDGCITNKKSQRPKISTSDNEHIINVFKELCYEYKISYFKNKNVIDVFFILNDKSKQLKKDLDKLGLLGLNHKQKFIPECYKIAPKEVRLSILQGLLDTDGCCDRTNGNVMFYSTNEQLAKDVKFIAQSLGMYACINSRPGRNRGEYKCSKSYSVYIASRDDSKLFRIERKSALTKKRRNGLYNTVVKAEIKPKVKMRCITVSNPNGLFLLDNFVVTHNSVWLCAEGIRLSMEYPGNVGYMCRKTYRDFKKTTLTTLMGMLPTKAIKAYNKVDGEIHLVNGSLIILGDLEQVEKLKSLNLGWFGIDEGTETTDQVFLMLRSRLRLKLPNIQRFGLIASNPEPGWLKDRFVDPQLRGQPRPNHLFIPSLPRENKHLPVGYIEDLERDFPPIWRSKYLEGSWDVFESQVFKPDWLKRTDTMPEMAVHFVAVDPAIGENEENDETAICVMGIGYDDDTIHEIETRHGRWSFNDIVLQCESVYQKYKPDFFGVEYVTFQKALGDVLVSKGIIVIPIKADRDKLRRAMSVQDMVEKGKVRINTYELEKQLLEFPKGRFDDLADAAIYVLRMIKNMSSGEYKKKIDRYAELKGISKQFWKDHDAYMNKAMGLDRSEVEAELLEMIER